MPPRLQVKTLRVLQYFPAPEDPAVRKALVDTLKRILGGEAPAGPGLPWPWLCPWGCAPFMLCCSLLSAVLHLQPSQ